MPESMYMRSPDLELMQCICPTASLTRGNWPFPINLPSEHIPMHLVVLPALTNVHTTLTTGSVPAPDLTSKSGITRC
eukprot:1900066-Prorocentrum_lima.AAC.1